MVFRDSLKEPKVKTEGTEHDSPVMAGLQGQVSVQPPASFKHNLRVSEDDLHLLAYMLLANKTNTKCVGQGLLDQEVHSLTFGYIRLNGKKPVIVARSGEKNYGKASDDSLLPGLNDDMALNILARSSRSDFPNLSYLNRKFRSLIGSGYLYKLRRQLGIREHWIYLACNLMPWEAFDPLREKWMRLPRIPCDDCFTCADKESLAVGTELLVFGRELSGFAIWMYSLTSNNWSRCPLMNLSRCLFGSSTLGEIAIVAGGSDKHGNVLKSAELYSSELGTWQTLPDMNVQRKLCSGFFMDGKFYVIGGMLSHTDCLTCGEEYNMGTRSWRRIENMYPGSSAGGAFHPAMRSPPLVAVINNQLYSADQATNEVKKYDKVNNSWNVVKRLPVRADSSNGWGLAFKACGNSLLVIGAGGHGSGDHRVIVLHSWKPEEGTRDGSDWSVLAVKERAGAFVYNCAVMGC
ncbi:F-box/kelch-repeat protein [Hibiscus syriacus]|uniref:F-box/kelch-repeat protein n=1 Tax=Hibiscus syriacus TaxID=106335 RepID=A0A6A3B495_HIBSY|nr:F-box/kelch-repeat protein At5g60570-like [Hibiscus syriacus]XP_038992573.1 F-box/kelch-repeat protein At5g60570-like [Hibiscus syriacus]KAE8711586.1 F-box/kelch-repeat protein [Hibiscus syriacus]